MGKALTPDELREKARALMKKAEEEEAKRYSQIGRLIVGKLNKKGAFSSNDAEKLKSEIAEIKDKINQIMNS